MANFVTDKRERLTIECAPAELTNQFPSIRGLVRYDGRVIFRGLPHPQVYEVNPPPGLVMDECLLYTAYEGALVNVFWAEDKWWFCTNKKLCFDRASWCAAPGSFKRAFTSCLRKLWQDDSSWGDPFDKSYLQRFGDLNLDKETGYVFMAYEPEESIACASKIQNLRLLATYCKRTDTHNYNCRLVLTCGTEIETPAPLGFRSVIQLDAALAEQDPSKCAGIIIVDSRGVHYKILPERYASILAARGEQPRLLNRLYQLMEMDQEGERHIETLCAYYPHAKVAYQRMSDFRERIVQCYLATIDEDWEPQVWMSRYMVNAVMQCLPGTERIVIDRIIAGMTTGQRKKFYKNHSCLAGGRNAWIGADAPMKQEPTLQDILDFPDE
ncbi:putative immediate early protein ICP-46 [Largemouth bass virus]|uniref:Immediate early protein ICP-46 n=1 Tax=Largemouth bass virus TaxID=176656 RepID=A0A9E7PPC3_9VIRU|nr:putative immediate early protein ICP-46 [Largemouth bass virus]WAK75137.1 putative immediate early protein ICP-46 [Mandarin fish ranavirus]WEI29026.1 putative immediate early protein ICP-46 [Largemouth bass virus]WHA35593.1 putative immediate early protein ICP-46 [Micropterus salmoides ranavirus]WHA35698.1 putative immediate early protein ICP-46 [Siniperca chuatsi ranavirus]